MVQISKLAFTQETWQQLWSKVISLVYQSPNRDSTHALLNGLLSNTEQIVIAKRLMASILLLSEWNPYEVSRLIRLSIATVYKIKNHLENNEDYVNEIRKFIPQPIPYLPEYKELNNISTIVDQILVNKTSQTRILYGSVD